MHLFFFDISPLQFPPLTLQFCLSQNLFRDGTGGIKFILCEKAELLFERWYQNNIWSLSPKKNLSRFTRVGSTRQSPYLVGYIRFRIGHLTFALIYLRWLHWPGGAQHRGWQLGLGMVGDFCFLGHFCCFAISWYIFKFQISRGHGSRLCASSKIIVQWYIFQRGKAQVARDGCSEALSGSDVNGTNMQGCHDQSGGDQIDNHNHNLNHNHE